MIHPRFDHMLSGLACTAQGCYTTPHIMVITAATAFLRCIPSNQPFFSLHTVTCDSSLQPGTGAFPRPRGKRANPKKETPASCYKFCSRANIKRIRKGKRTPAEEDQRGTQARVVFCLHMGGNVFLLRQQSHDTVAFER